MIVLTGGGGLLGNAFKKILPNELYPTSKQLNLRNQIDVSNYLSDSKIDTVIHLAAKVGGVKANTDFVSDFYTYNSEINQKVLDYARIAKAKKVVSLLSTCVYPDAPYVTFPLTEDQLHMGPPHSSNFGYAYAKRMIDVMSRANRLQYGCNFITAIPNNLYGESDNFDLENGHVIPAIIRKIWESKIFNKPENMELAVNLLNRLSGKKHSLYSSICLSKNGSTIWMHTEQDRKSTRLNSSHT